MPKLRRQAILFKNSTVSTKTTTTKFFYFFIFLILEMSKN